MFTSTDKRPLKLTCRLQGWPQRHPAALLLQRPVLHHQACCLRMRHRHPRSASSQGHDRLLRAHQMHQVGRIEARHSLVAGVPRVAGWDRGSLVADVLRIAGSGLDSLAVGAREVGRERCCGLGRSSAGIGPMEAHHSCAGELVHTSCAKVEDTGSARLPLASAP